MKRNMQYFSERLVGELVDADEEAKRRTFSFKPNASFGLSWAKVGGTLEPRPPAGANQHARATKAGKLSARKRLRSAAPTGGCHPEPCVPLGLHLHRMDGWSPSSGRDPAGSPRRAPEALEGPAGTAGAIGALGALTGRSPTRCGNPTAGGVLAPGRMRRADGASRVDGEAPDKPDSDGRGGEGGKDLGGRRIIGTRRPLGGRLTREAPRAPLNVGHRRRGLPGAASRGESARWCPRQSQGDAGPQVGR